MVDVAPIMSSQPFDSPIRGGENNARFTTSATVFSEILRLLQYSDSNQSARSLVPLLALHETQHLAMLSRFTILASLTMCSQVGAPALGALAGPKVMPQ
jgi:hypothetical protein